MIESLLLVLTGILVGGLGTIIGVGGGFVIVPLLSIIYQFSPQHAVGTSMAIVALNAISGTAAYVRQKRIDYRTGLFFAAATLPGSFLGAFLLQHISRTVFDIGFSIFMIATAAYIGVRKQSPAVEIDIRTFHRPDYNRPLGLLISFFVGFVASMAGIGGGVIHVPAMIYLFLFPPYIAIPTSHFILAISATFAAASHASIGEVEWGFIPTLGLGAVIGAQIGGILSHRIKGKWIVRGLLAVMVLGAARLILRNLP